METITKIEKEIIPSLSFRKEEILISQEHIKRRKANISKAMTLGNGQKRKVKIFFELDSGEKYAVETTIWAAGQDYVSLKAGTSIPIHAISSIEF